MPIIKINNQATTEVNRTLQRIYSRCVKADLTPSVSAGDRQLVNCSAYSPSISCISDPERTVHDKCISASASTDSRSTSIIIAGKSD